MRFQNRMPDPLHYFSRFLNTRKLYAVALSAEDAVRVRLTFESLEYDVTDDHALISLIPFAIALNAAAIHFSKPQRAKLILVSGQSVLGELPLTAMRTEVSGGLTLYLYEAGHPGYPVSLVFRLWNTCLLFIKNVSNRKSRNFVVPPVELMKLFVFSLKPRVVYLLSLRHENGLDAFPVDLAGYLDAEHVIFSIRSSSPVIPFLASGREVCASVIPFSCRASVYPLGRHHPGAVIPDASLLNEFISSARFQIPVPSYAVQVLELVSAGSFVTGMHTQFVFRVMNAYAGKPADALAHTPWFNRQYFKNRFDLK